MKKIIAICVAVCILTPLCLFAGERVRVRGYVKKNGTYVQPHYRSAPDGNPYNNWSYPGNINPYTGKKATGNPDTYLRNHYKSGSLPANGSKSNVGDLRGQLQSSEQQVNSNLETCLAGKYPALCNHSLLTAEQKDLVRNAEAAENYETCSSGKYPTLCKHTLLTPTQAEVVKKAEMAENYETCKTGKYPSLCKHALLTTDQAAVVERAELNENYSTCLIGRYPSLCKHSLLTPAQAIQVREAEQLYK